ncbi:MAG: hypothetical protein KZQ82_15710 [Candidatus Thiodiazotropha sp. (ex Lucinoma annulata)]|nr:hypothetical protein [Candidatus Thiodiazotropha sp. (ex Lucinoma borealis)]MCU7885637.1 hypothetical protein [Candidatus Thiodiazotropha sp. (ex Lucinoma annulata)]
MSNLESIYKAPVSDLVIKEELPEGFLYGVFTSKKLKNLTYLSFFYLILMIPLIGISFMSGFEPDNYFYGKATNVLTVIDAVIFIYLLVMFKALINHRFEFHGANRYISILIGLTFIMTVVSLFMPANPQEMDIVTISYFVLMVPLGIITILFGKRLLSIETEYNYLKLYSWSSIITGVCLATVVLFLLALPLSLVSSFAMAMLFLTASNELEGA